MLGAVVSMRKINELSDENLLQQMLDGDRAAFEMLYHRRKDSVYRFALRMSGSVAMAEDVTHDVFIDLIRDGHMFDPNRGTVASYLYGMTRNRVWRNLKRDRAFELVDDEPENGALVQEQMIVSAVQLQQLERGEMAELVWQAVLALPEHYREVVVLCNLEEMSYEQAAKVIGCPVGTVRSRLNRARNLLTEKLQSLPIEKPAVNNRAVVGGEQ